MSVLYDLVSLDCCNPLSLMIEGHFTDRQSLTTDDASATGNAQTLTADSPVTFYLLMER